MNLKMKRRIETLTAPAVIGKRRRSSTDHRRGPSTGKSKGYSMSASATAAEIFLFDEIGFGGVDSEQFALDLAEITAPEIVVRINSPGGDVFDGLAIYNSLKLHRAKISTRVEGLAASIAAVIAMAGTRVEIASGAFLMTHRPWVRAVGDEDALLEALALLRKITGPIEDIFCRKTGKARDEIRRLMRAETWFTGKEAVAEGFADALISHETEGNALAARLKMREHNLAAFPYVNAPGAASGGAPAGDGRTEGERNLSLIERLDARRSQLRSDKRRADIARLAEAGSGAR